MCRAAILECRLIPREGSLLIASVGTDSQTHVTCKYSQLAQARRAESDGVEEGCGVVAAASLQMGSRSEKSRSWFSQVAGIARETCGRPSLPPPQPRPLHPTFLFDLYSPF